jgi:hypothetical protein
MSTLRNEMVSAARVMARLVLTAAVIGTAAAWFFGSAHLFALFAVWVTK